MTTSLVRQKWIWRTDTWPNSERPADFLWRTACKRWHQMRIFHFHFDEERFWQICCLWSLCVFRTGPNTWRDSQTPKEILEEFCQSKNLTGPIYSGSSTVKVGNRVFNLADFGKNSHFLIVIQQVNWIFRGQSAPLCHKLNTWLFSTREKEYLTRAHTAPVHSQTELKSAMTCVHWTEREGWFQNKWSRRTSTWAQLMSVWRCTCWTRCPRW